MPRRRSAPKFAEARIALYGRTTGISEPFDAGERIEIKIEIEPGQVWQGELYLRAGKMAAADYEVGEVFSVVLTRVE